MIGRLDRYVGSMVLAAYGACLVFMVFLSVLVDMLNNLGDYLDKADRNGLGTVELFAFLGRYYAELTPFFFVTVAPFITVIACMFAVSRLMSTNELAPMVFTGRSMFRILQPVLLTGVLSGLAMAACWEWVLPRMMQSITEKQALLSGQTSMVEGLVLEPGSGKYLYAQRYLHRMRRLEEVRYLDEGTTPGDAVEVTASAAVWDPEQGDWRLEGGRMRRGAVSESCNWLGEPGFTPELVWQAGLGAEQSADMSYSDLLTMRKLRPARRDYQLALHHHITFPLANVILLLLALPFAVHFERGGKIERVVFAILVCGGYLLVDLTCQSLGRREWLHPVVAAWSPTILFGSLGFVMFGSIRT